MTSVVQIDCGFWGEGDCGTEISVKRIRRLDYSAEEVNGYGTLKAGGEVVPTLKVHVNLTKTHFDRP